MLRCHTQWRDSIDQTRDKSRFKKTQTFTHEKAKLKRDNLLSLYTSFHTETCSGFV